MAMAPTGAHQKLIRDFDRHTVIPCRTRRGRVVFWRRAFTVACEETGRGANSQPLGFSPPLKTIVPDTLFMVRQPSSKLRGERLQ
jgi:hypothetical protein